MAGVTQAQVDKLQADFDSLLDDVTNTIPHSRQIDMALMIFHMAESLVMSLVKQYLVKA